MTDREIVRIVLGEAAEPYPGTLRCVLEGEGFDIVGQACNEAELERVLAGVKPAAIVLGAELGAMPVLTAREKAPNARIVVVWPRGVSAAIADQRVEPSRVFEDLGAAVRRATRPSLEEHVGNGSTPIGTPSLAAVNGRRIGASRNASTESPEPAGLRRSGVLAMLAAACLVLLVASAWALSGPNRPGRGTSTQDPSLRSPAALQSPAHIAAGGHDPRPKNCNAAKGSSASQKGGAASQRKSDSRNTKGAGSNRGGGCGDARGRASAGKGAVSNSRSSASGRSNAKNEPSGRQSNGSAQRGAAAGSKRRDPKP